MAHSIAVVWERLNEVGKWCTYSGDVCQLIEQTYLKKLTSVCLGDVDPSLKLYSVNVKEMLEVSEITGSKCIVRRRLCDEGSSVASAILWQWRGDYHHSWHCYSADIADIIEKNFQSGNQEIDLSNYFLNYPYKLCFSSMMQKNKKTKYHRPIRRIVSSPFPKFDSSSSECETSDAACAATTSVSNVGKSSQKKSLLKHVNSLWNKIVKHDSDSYSSSEDSPKNSGNKKQCTSHVLHFSDLDGSPYEHFSNATNLYPDLSAEGGSSNDNSSTSNNTIPDSEVKYAIVNGKPWKHSWYPSVPQSQLKPVPGFNPLPSDVKNKSREKGKKKKVMPTAPANIDVFEQYTEEVSVPPLDNTDDPEQMCNICFELLSNDSPYDDDPTLIKLSLCSHIYHKSCIQAMYNCGAKDNCLQCPTCKTIHGVKCGIQPPGEMVYHIIPYSLPGFHECETIRIIYDIHAGIQGPEHPNPGQRYSARGFPRGCYLPDNEMGRKILRLLISAWERRLIFTIGASSTTGEQNTVTWNEIHHKTEFGCNRRGHGYPDPNYFMNVIAELAAQGVTETTCSEDST